MTLLSFEALLLKALVPYVNFLKGEVECFGYPWRIANGGVTGFRASLTSNDSSNLPLDSALLTLSYTAHGNCQNQDRPSKSSGMFPSSGFG
jgi:hypothetical protein